MKEPRALLRLAAIALLVLAGCAAPQDPIVLREGRPAMGTVLEITLVAPNEAIGREWIQGSFARVAEIERQSSSWEPTSKISQLNRLAASGPAELDVGPVVAELLADAKRVARETEGAFDVSVGPLIALWRQGAATNQLPEPATLETRRALVGADRIQLSLGRAALAHGMSIDLGGFSKGWALQQVERWLREQGAHRGLLNFGGSSLLAMGAPQDASAWRVLVGARDQELGVLSLVDAHASISASLGQTFSIGDQEFGHVIDPRTGTPVNREVFAVAVGPSGADTEAWSTALLVRGAEGFSAAHEAGLEIMVVEAETTLLTPDFPPFEWLEPEQAW
jgi:thiamine biosynthesis lipoprotein